MEQQRLTEGSIVRHFKREFITDPASSEYLYVIVGIGKHTETGEKFVMYRKLYGDKSICMRPYDMFMSEVDREKYPAVQQVYRFESCTWEDLLAIIRNMPEIQQSTLVEIIRSYIK